MKINKSFASHEKIIYWSSKNKENSRHLFQGNSNKYWFNCEKCDIEFESVLYTPMFNLKFSYFL